MTALRVYLDVTVGDMGLAKAVADHVAARWSARGVLLWRAGEDLEDDTARLVVGNGQSRLLDGGAVRDRVDIDRGRETDRDELLFRLDAKLGRLVHSDMAASKRSLVRSGGTTSRRDFFLGLRHLYRVPSGFPVCLEDRCEAKYGCVKCVESCPVEAIRLNRGALAVDESRCIECGLCAAACPVAAVQMPWFSEESLMGLLDGIDERPAGAKSLVITCKRESVPIVPWMDVEEVAGVGAVGRQQLVAAADSSLGAIMVYCPDGMCPGSEGARRATEAVSAAISGNLRDGSRSGKIVAYLEGSDMDDRLVQLHRAAFSAQPRLSRRGVEWKSYVESLNRLVPRGAPTQGLGFTESSVSETCTVCGECAKSCPHGAFGVSRGELNFNSGACTGCGFCVRVCPQKSIELLTAGAGTRFPLAPHLVFKDAVALCKGCGKPMGSRKFLEGVSGTAHINTEVLCYCPSCTRKKASEAALVPGSKQTLG